MTGSAEEDRPALQGLHEMLWFLMSAAILNLLRAGQTRQMTVILVERLGEEKGTGVAERFPKVVSRTVCSTDRSSRTGFSDPSGSVCSLTGDVRRGLANTAPESGIADWPAVNVRAS